MKNADQYSHPYQWRTERDPRLGTESTIYDYLTFKLKDKYTRLVCFNGKLGPEEFRLQSTVTYGGLVRSFADLIEFVPPAPTPMR